MITLEQLLAKLHDNTLMDIQRELQSGLVPRHGSSHTFCRHVNRAIDSGKLRINQTTFRRLYLPTLAKAVQRELACRYLLAYTIGRLVPTTNIEMTLEEYIDENRNEQSII